MDVSSTFSHAQPLPRGLAGYVTLLRQNPNFRNLWIGQVISDLGDWFNTVAVLGLLQELTHNALGSSLQIVFQMLPGALAGLFISGWVADRFDRRTVIIVTHIVRAILALAYLFVDTPEMVWLAYLATITLSIGNSFFQPASSAALPNLCKPGELTTANALQQSSFASVIFIGAFIGGVVAQWLGRDVAFVINALSFLWAAYWTWRVRGSFADASRREQLNGGSAVRVLTDGARYLRTNPKVGMFSLLKPVWAFTFGASGLYSAYSFGIYATGDMGTSWLYAGRGLGAFIGPLLIGVLVAPKALRQFATIAIGSLALSMIGYTVFGLSLTPIVGALGVGLGHLGGASLWTFSRLYLQRETPDRLRGRVLSLDQVLFWLTNSCATLMLGALATATTLPFAVLAGVGASVLLTAAWGLVMFRFFVAKTGEAPA